VAVAESVFETCLTKEAVPIAPAPMLFRKVAAVESTEVPVAEEVKVRINVVVDARVEVPVAVAVRVLGVVDPEAV